MKVCDLHTGSIRLTRAAKKLRDQWRDTKEHWKDQNSRDFERNHLEPIAPEITLTLAAVQRMTELLDQAERECTDEEYQ